MEENYMGREPFAECLTKTRGLQSKLEIVE